MSTSEQHTDVNRRDQLADQPNRMEGDPMVDRTEEPRGTGPTTDELLSGDVQRDEPGLGEPRGRDDLARDDLARDDLARDDLARDDLPATTDDSRVTTWPATTWPATTWPCDLPGPTARQRVRTNGAAICRRAGATAGTTSAGTGVGSGTTAGDDTTDERAPLVSRDRADQYASRWNEVKGMFVDEPRQAVQQADALVGDLLDDLEQLFRAQRQEIEHGLDTDDTSTEDLRMALRRYRSFFDRLLAV